MREILFRGKDPESGEWYYGYYVKRNDGDRGDLILEDYYLESYEIVKHKTVGQYTGLTDKNDTKIFEGDIVRYVIVDIDGSEDAYIGAICFEPEKVGFAIKRDDYRAFFVNSWLIDIEIIGNIYDNPELMNG